MGRQFVGIRKNDTEVPEPALDERHARIWSVGELGGGTSYFGRDNLLGIYRMLKDRIPGGKYPDLIVFHGEVLPEIPKFISKQGRQRSLIISDLVENIDEASVMMKPHLSRISDVIREKGAKTKIAYIMGHSDLMNIDREYDILNSSYNYDPRHIFIMRQRYIQMLSELEKKTESLRLQISEKEKAVEVLKSKRWKSKAVDKLTVDISKLREKEEQKISELDDNRDIKNLYSGFVKAWIIDGSHNLKYLMEKVGDCLDHELFEVIARYRKEDAVDLAKNYETELEKIIAKIKAEGGKPKSHKTVKKLEKKSKEIGNLLTKLSNEIITREKAGEERKHDNRLEHGYRFTNNIPGTPTRSKISYELACKVVRSRIRDVFGRRLSIDIIGENCAAVELNGLKLFLSNKPSNTSHMFLKSPNKGVGSINWALRTVSSNADIMITSGSPLGLSTYVPKYDQSEQFCYQLSSPPCVNSAKIVDAWNARLKTWFTEILTKGKGSLGSGFDEIEVQGNKIKHTFFSEDMLRRIADLEKESQLLVLAKMIERAGTYESSPTQLDKKDRIQLSNKLPREITNKRLFSRMVEDLGIKNSAERKALGGMVRSHRFDGGSALVNKNALEFFSKYLVPSDSGREIERKNFVVLTDVHVGSPGTGYPNELLLNAAVSYINDNVKDGFVLSLMGDNIEGNLRDHKNEVHLDNDPTNIARFKRFMEERGISAGTETYKKNLERYAAWLYYKTPKANTNAQAETFVDGVRQLLDDRRVSAVVVADGNHVNKSYIRKDVTESGLLFRSIEQSVPEEKRNAVKRVYGGDYGHGDIVIGDLPVLFSHRVVPEQIIGDLGMGEGLAIGGHRHIHELATGGGKVVFTGAQMQGNSGFPQTIGVPVSESLRGFSILSVYYDPKEPGKVLTATDTYINMRHLKDRGYIKTNSLIEKFEEGLSLLPAQQERIKLR